MKIKTVYDAIGNIEKLKAIQKELDNPKFTDGYDGFVISEKHRNYLQFLVDDAIKNIQNASICS